MTTPNIITLLLAILTLLNGCVWFTNWRKDKQEAKGLKKDNKQKDMNLSKMYVDEFRTNIIVPLQREVNMLRNAIQKIDRCPHRANCPVLDGLQHEPKDGNAGAHPEDGGQHRHGM